MKTWSTILRSAPLAGLVAMVTLLPHRADAQSPLDDVPASAYPILTVTCTNWGKLTGADGDVGSSTWVASSDGGALLFFDGTNAAPSKVVGTGRNLTGVAMLGNNAFAISEDQFIYEGTVSGTNWVETRSMFIQGVPSGITDLDYSFGKYFVATGTEIRRVENDGSTTLLKGGMDGDLKSIKFIEFNDGVYSNPMNQIYGVTFFGVDSTGNILDGGRLGNFNHSGSKVEGVAYIAGDGGKRFMVIVANGPNNHGFDIYNGDDFAYIQNIKALGFSPERPTLSIANGTGNTFTLTWPTNFLGFNVQASPALSVAFTNLACSPVVAGTNWSVELSPTESSAFFRLSQ